MYLASLSQDWVNFWDSITAFFSNVWEFISNLIDSIIVFISFVAEGWSFFVVVEQFLPTFLGVSLLTAISISILKLLLGK